MCALVGDGGASTARQRPLSWLLKIIDSVYEAYLRREDADPSWHVSSDPSVRASRLLSVFTVQYLTKLHGLRHIVEQVSWDLVYNVEAYRNDYADVDLFAEFLSDKLNFDDLLFFLRARVVSFAFAGSRRPTVEKAPQPLAPRQCTEAAESIFSAISDSSGLQLLPPFLSALETLLAARRRKTVDVSEFLRLAVLHYHASVPPPAVSSSTVVSDMHRLASLRSNYEDTVRRAETELEKKLALFEDLRRQSRAALESDKQMETRRTDVLNSVRRAMVDKGLVDESTPGHTALAELKAQTIAQSVLASSARPATFDSVVSHDSISEEYTRYAPQKQQQQQQQASIVAAEASALFPPENYSARRLVADGGRPWEWSGTVPPPQQLGQSAPTATTLYPAATASAAVLAPPAALSSALPAATSAQAVSSVDLADFSTSALMLTAADLRSLKTAAMAAEATTTAAASSASTTADQQQMAAGVDTSSVSGSAVTLASLAGVKSPVSPVTAAVASGSAAQEEFEMDEFANMADDDVWMHISLPDETIEMLRRTTETYVNVLLRSAQDTLSADVLDDIRAIAEQHAAMSVATLAVSGQAAEMLQQAPDLAAGCRAIIASPEVREAVEPLVALLVLQSKTEAAALSVE